MTPNDIFARMGPRQADDLLGWLAENDRPAYKSCGGMLAARRKLRPVFVERKSRTERIQWMKDALARPANADLAAETLQLWTLGANEKVVCDFLDSIGIAHDGKGLLDEVPAEPAIEKVDNAVDLLLSNHGAMAVFIYLHLFSSMSPDTWPRLRGILEEHELLRPELVFSL
jgi:hypothetical protein